MVKFMNNCIDENTWSNYEWQKCNTIHKINDLNTTIESGKELEESFRMAVTPYYFNLIDWSDKQCPIKAMIVPNEKELLKYDDCISEKYHPEDSLHEEKYMPVKNLVHRYPDRVLLLITNNCFSYCRFCTRKRVTASSHFESDLGDAIHYIELHNEIRDVLISGGDPLTYSDDYLESIIARVRTIPHVEIIRIGSRAPVVMPMRITDQLVTMLRKYQPIWLNTHFNHPKELTTEAEMACAKIIDAGIPMGNQTVLLKGINDREEILTKLFTGLVKMRIRPYYLYQCDISEGNQHFITTVKKGIQLMDNIVGTITGFAVPTYVIDLPNGGGKSIISKDHVLEYKQDEVVVRNFENNVFTYPEIN